MGTQWPRSAALETAVLVLLVVLLLLLVVVVVVVLPSECGARSEEPWQSPPLAPPVTAVPGPEPGPVLALAGLPNRCGPRIPSVRVFGLVALPCDTFYWTTHHPYRH
jgi:hypothetical protein